MNNKKLNFKKLLFLSCFITGIFLAIFLMGFCKNVNALQDAVLSPVEISPIYYKGNYFQVPSATISVGNQNKKAHTILHYPNGEAKIVKDEILLDTMGAYCLEYTCILNEKRYSFDKKFDVYTNRYQVIGEKGDSKWYKYDYNDPYTKKSDSMEGELVTLYDEEKLIINDYFDIKKATKEIPILSLAIIPDKMGKEDFSTLTINFVNKLNPEKKLSIIANYNYGNDMTYFLAGGETQTPSGVEHHPAGDRIHVGNNWGAPWQGSFQGRPIASRKKTIKDDIMKIFFDYENKIIYVNSQKGFVIDLDSSEYFSTIWEGFTDGMVNIEIQASRYQSSNPAKILLLNIANGDIEVSQSSQEFTDTQKPEIVVDTGKYDEESLPNGIVNQRYPIFPASAYDWWSGNCNTIVRVFGRYNTTQKYELSIQDNSFIPNETGVFVIEYSSIDFCGNKAIKTCEINVVSSCEDIIINIDDTGNLKRKTGELINLPIAHAEGGVGNLTICKTVLFNGKTIDSEYDSFRAQQVGTYAILYKAVDYLGNFKEKQYNIEVVENDEAIFIDEIVLPKYFIEGSTYDLPKIKAYFYSANGEIIEVKTTVIVEDKNGEKEIEDYLYCPFVANHLDEVKIKYKANYNNHISYSETHNIAVCKVRNNNSTTGKNIDMTKYFVANKMVQMNATPENIEITTKNDATISFINPLIADRFEFEFDIDPTKNSFTRMNIFLEDSLSMQTIKLTYSKLQGSKSYLSLNDGKNYIVNSSFYGTGISSFYFIYDSTQNKITDNQSINLMVTNDINGNMFKGFTSGKIYLSFSFEGVNGDSCAQIKNIGGQRFSDFTMDMVKPKLSYLGDRELRYFYGDIITIPPMVVADVLDPNVTAYYSVVDPLGNIVIDDKGKTLEQVSIDYQPTFKLDKYGFYNLIVYIEDWNGKKEKNSGYAMNVVDKMPPVIKLNEGYLTKINKGDNIVLATASSFDEIDGDLDVVVFIKTPAGVLCPCKNGNFKPSEVGKYKVIYYSIDNSGNTASLDYYITVEE